MGGNTAVITGLGFTDKDRSLANWRVHDRIQIVVGEHRLDGLTQFLASRQRSLVALLIQLCATAASEDAANGLVEQTTIDDVGETVYVRAPECGQILIQIDAKFVTDNSRAGNQGSQFRDFHLHNLHTLLLIPLKCCLDCLPHIAIGAFQVTA